MIFSDIKGDFLRIVEKAFISPVNVRNVDESHGAFVRSSLYQLLTGLRLGRMNGRFKLRGDDSVFNRAMSMLEICHLGYLD